MRTTIDLPDEVFRQAKARAALEGRKFKELIAEYVEQGLTRSTDLDFRAARASTPLPYIPKASTGGTIPALSSEELARIEEEEDLESHRRSLGR
jgi:hypothetical protein